MTYFSLFKDYNIELETSEEAIFRKFLDLFMEYNGHTNLSAIRTPEGIVEKHFIDSLMLGNFVELSWKVRWISTAERVDIKLAALSILLRRTTTPHSSLFHRFQPNANRGLLSQPYLSTFPSLPDVIK